MRRALVTGGSGFVGRHVCERLVRAGWQVTVPTRRRTNAQAVQHLPGLDVIEADVHDARALAALAPGHDALVHLVAILHGSGADFDRVHVCLPRQLAAACAHAGVRRVVHVSALGADTQGPSMYQRSKAAGEAVWVASGLDVTVLRPSVIFGRDDRFVNLFAQLQRLMPVLPLAGARWRLQPVWVQDVAEAVMRCLADRRTIGQTYELAGPQVMTLAEIARLAGACAGVAHGRGRPVWPLPDALARVQAWAMERLPGPTLMSRDNLDSMRVDNVAGGRLPGLDALGITPSGLSALAPVWLGSGAGTPLDALRQRAGR